MKNNFIYKIKKNWFYGLNFIFFCIAINTPYPQIVSVFEVWLIIIISYFLYYSNIPLSENYNSLFYLITENVYYFLIGLVLFILLSLYFGSFNLLVSIFYLLIYDIFFVIILLPFLKKIVIKLNIKDILVKKDFLFKKIYSNKYDNNTILLMYPTVVLEQEKKSYNYKAFNNKVKNFLFLVEFYKKQGEIKYYLYPFLVIIAHTIFYIIVYKLYFISYVGKSSNLSTFLFLMIWLLYAAHNIEDILSINYYYGEFKKAQNDPGARRFLKNLNIGRVVNHKLYREDITIYLNEIKLYLKLYDKKMELMIILVSTVIFIGLLTFMSFYKPPEIKQKPSKVIIVKGDINETTK